MLVQDREELGLAEVKAEGLHGDFKLVVVDAAVAVEVKEDELCCCAQ